MKLRWVVSGLALLAVLGAIVFAWLAVRALPPRDAGEERPWPAPAFRYPDQDGEIVSDASLRGHPYVADFIFTRCTTACPLLSARMVQLQRRVAAPGVRFISFSVDPEHDTPAALHEYAARWAPKETRWRLLSTTPEGLRQTTAGFHVAVLQTGDADNPFLHSNHLELVDAEGVVRGEYDSETPAELERLRRDLLALAGGAPTSADAGASPARSGEQLYRELGCRGCHGERQIAMPLAGVAGSEVTLSDGMHLHADDAYLRESILAPNAKLVAGYAPIMPSYEGQLAPGELDALVAWLDAQPAAPGAAVEAARTVETDPVCQMKVSVGSDTPKEEYRGRAFHFCSDRCARAFHRDPARYAGR